MLTFHDLLRTWTLRAGGRTPTPIPSPPSPWSAASAGRRVVIENEDVTWQWASTRILETAGYEVACCGGPHQLPYHQCPLVAGDQCALVDGADVVVTGLGIRDPANRAVLTALRTRRDQIPVIAEIPAPQMAELHVAIPGCRTVALPVGPRGLVAAVDDVLCSGQDTGAAEGR